MATVNTSATEMMAGEFEDCQVYEYNGLEFFPAYNQLWNPLAHGDFAEWSSRVIRVNRDGSPILDRSLLPSES